MLNKWSEFLKEVKSYEGNVGINDLLKLIDSLNGVIPQEQFYMGGKWLVFTGENFVLRFNPRTYRIETLCNNQLENDIEEVVRTTYVIELYDDMYVEKEVAVNQFTKVNGGYQLLCEMESSKERFTRTGFQKDKDVTFRYCPTFIFNLFVTIKKEWEIYCFLIFRRIINYKFACFIR